MSTRSLIAVLNDDNYQSVYCHFDGYEQRPGVGYVLRQLYSSKQDAQRLINLGDLSAVKEDSACAYHRDRGELWERNRPQTAQNYEALIRLAKSRDADYLYRFEGGQWLSDNIR